MLTIFFMENQVTEVDEDNLVRSQLAPLMGSATLNVRHLI